MNIEEILTLEKNLLDKECVICYNKFINIKDSNYEEFLDKIINKYNLNKEQSDSFEKETTRMCYDTRSMCLICTNSVCERCNEEQEDPNIDEVIQISVGRCVNGVPQELYQKASMADTGIITCPICRTKDIRQKITGKNFNNLMPAEVLYDIKKI